VIDLYGRRWKVEEAFLVVKRLLGLSYLWTGSLNGIKLQIWATWLMYAVLVDLSDAVAEAVQLPLERISMEMVLRVCNHFNYAYNQGKSTDPSLLSRS
jgi:IS4 transposase